MSCGSANGIQAWRGRRRKSTPGSSGGEDLRLLLGELLLGEDALVLQVRELLELGDRVGRCRGGGRRLRVLLRRRRLLLVLLLVLGGPAVGLAAGDAVRDG